MSALKIKLASVQDRVTHALTSSPVWMRWQGLSGEGQRIIKWSTALLALALIWAYVWLPASRGRAVLTARIPVLQTQLAEMKREVDDVKRINAMPLVVTSENRRTLADSVGLQTAFGPAATVTINDSRQFRVSIPSIAYTSWLDSLDTVLTRFRVRVVKLNLKPLDVKTPASTDARNGATLVAIELVLADDTGIGGK